VAIGATLIALLSLAGWAFGVERLESVLPGLPSMTTNTAICIVLISLALAITTLTPITSRRVGIARLAAIAAVSIAGLTLSEYLFHWNLGIDQLLHDAQPSAFPGRMAANTALAIMLVGTALAFLSDDSERGAIKAQLLASGSGLIALFGLIGYIFGASYLYSIASFTPMAVISAAAIFGLSGGLFWAKPDRGFMRVVHSNTSAGVILRTLLPAAILVPIAIGWLRLEGQRLGYYDTTFGVLLLVSVSALIFSALTISIASRLYAVEASREQAQADLKTALATVEARVSMRTLELNHALEKLEISEQRHVLAKEGSNSATLDLDLRADTLYCSPTWYEILGITERDKPLSRSDFVNLIHPEDREAAVKMLSDHYGDSSVDFSTEVRMLHHDGTYRWMLSRGRALRDAAGVPTRMVGSQTDITELKQLQEALHNETIKDDLTGLFNRRYFTERLSAAVQLANRHSRPVSLCLCDIDEFKTVNDRFGHRSGDEVLVTFAGALSAETRGGDICARYGGDEFCIIFSETTAADAVAGLERVRSRIENHVFFDGSGERYAVTASFGVTDLAGKTVPQFMDAADRALYTAKRSGRNRTFVDGAQQA